MIDQSNTTISSSNERSPLAESFRVLLFKIKNIYSDENKKEGQITMVTSTVKGEGKTLCSKSSFNHVNTWGKNTSYRADLHITLKFIHT